MSKLAEAGYDNIGGVSDMDKKITKEEFAKSFLSAYGGMLENLKSGKPIKGNAREFIAEMKKWTDEKSEDE